MKHGADPHALAQQLRRDFDESFARPPLPSERVRVDYLGVRVGGAPYALAASETAGLFVDKKLTPVPSLLPELLGIAGFRASVVPVYDLAALLGRESDGKLRFWCVVGRERPVALAFERFDGYRSLTDGPQTAPGQVRTVAWPDGTTRAVLELSRLMAKIADRVRERTEKEK